jgi:hypothetical protein
MATWLNPTSPDHGLTEPEEMHQGQSESFAYDAVSAAVQLKCLWSQRHAIVYNMLAGPTPWPYAPGNGMYAAKIGVTPFAGEAGAKAGTNSQFYSYDYATLNVGFQTIDIQDGENPVMYSESIEPSAEFITLDPANYRWGSSSGAQVKEGPGRLAIGLDYVVTIFNQLSVPSWVLSLIGCVNNDAVVSASLGLTFGSGTLLFNPPKISRSVAFGSSNRYQIVTRYSFRPDGWNKFWRPDKGTPAGSSPGYDSMYHKDSGDVAYLNYTPASFAGAIP